MASITIHDLPDNVALDCKAMATIRGGDGAPWLFGGWDVPFQPSTQTVGTVANLYQITNNFTAGQMINEFQSINVNNTGSNSNISVAPNEQSKNHSG
jgi:hypothetical protein